MAKETRDDRTDAQHVWERLLAATPLAERHEPLAGVSTAILEGGDGPPMVLLHGQGEFWAVWMPVIDDLVRTNRVIVVDLPGHGTSTLVDGRLDAATLGRWVDELIDATCPEPPVLAGHLLGGAIAARYAVTHAQRLAHLVLVDTMGLNWYRPSPRFAVPMVRFAARPTARSRDRLFHQCMLDFDRVGARFGDHWDDLLAYALDRATTSENQAALRALMPRLGMPAIPSDDLDRIAVPTTLIHGRHDLQVPLRAAEKASARHSWPLYVINGARDDPAAEQPEAFLDALRRALADNRDRSEERDAS
ncbi:MAG: alpha/beta hydrolase [Euzebyales bacterium]|nr:alpha/beta hydrolase [Euzebyales bacterium]